MEQVDSLCPGRTVCKRLLQGFQQTKTTKSRNKCEEDSILD